MIRFYTGIFVFEEGCCNTAQRPHDEKAYDDDVFSGLSSYDDIIIPYDDISGCVSNVGATAIIHIKEEFNTAENIEYVKKIFQLGENSGLTEMKVAVISGAEK